MDVAREPNCSQSTYPILDDHEYKDGIVRYVDVETEILNKKPNDQGKVIYKDVQPSKIKHFAIKSSGNHRSYNSSEDDSAPTKLQQHNVTSSHSKPVYYARRSTSNDYSVEEHPKTKTALTVKMKSPIRISPNIKKVVSGAMPKLYKALHTSKKTAIKSAEPRKMPVLRRILPKIGNISYNRGISTKVDLQPVIRTNSVEHKHTVEVKSSQGEATKIPTEAVTKAEFIKNILSTTDVDEPQEGVGCFPENSKIDSTVEIPNLNSIEIIDDSGSGEDDVELNKKNESNSTKTSTRNKTVLRVKSVSDIAPSTSTLIKPAPPGMVKTDHSVEAKSALAATSTMPLLITTQTLINSQGEQSDNQNSSIANIISPMSAGQSSISAASTPTPGTVLPESNLVVPGSLPTSINFVVPRTEIIRCKQANVPLILAVPPIMQTAKSPAAPGNLLMVLPSQLPNTLPSKGAVNFLVSTLATKGNANPVVNGNSIVQNVTSGTQSTVKMPGHIKSQATPEISRSNDSHKSGDLDAIPRKGVPQILNTKEKDGPIWCWYASKVGKRDLDGFLYKDRLGFSKAEVAQAKRCYRKLNTEILKKQLVLDMLGSKIVALKRGYRVKKCRDIKENISPQNIPVKVQSKRNRSPGTLKNVKENKKIKHSDQISTSSKDNVPLYGKNEGSNSHFQDNDDDSSELYYTKKVVILRNNARRRRKGKSKIRIRPIQRTPRTKQLKAVKTSLPPVRQCRVILERDPVVEEETRKQFGTGVTRRVSRKRKLDLESMGLIKKVRRRNAVDLPVINTETRKSKSIVRELKNDKFKNLNDLTDESESHIVSNKSHSETSLPDALSKGDQFSKGSQRGVKKVTSMSYREYQKITKLSPTEVSFIFIMNTVQQLKDLKINESKPLLILDRFNYKFDFDHINLFNIIFTRDDDEIIPIDLLKNLEFVYFVRCGLIKVVSRPVLCKYILEQNDIAPEKSTKEQKPYNEEIHPRSKFKKGVKKDDAKDRFVKTLSLTRRASSEPKVEENTSKGAVINVRQDLMQPTSSGDFKTVSQKSPYVKNSSSARSRTKNIGNIKTRESKNKDETKKKTNSNLDLKFSEIESNLSKMFGKPKTSSLDTHVVSSESVTSTSVFDDALSKNTFETDTMGNDLSADLDYLLDNSAEETINLEVSSEETKIDIVQHVLSDAIGSKSLDESSKNQTHLIDGAKNTKNTEKLATSNLQGQNSDTEACIIDVTNDLELGEVNLQNKSMSQEPDLNVLNTKSGHVDNEAMELDTVKRNGSAESSASVESPALSDEISFTISEEIKNTSSSCIPGSEKTTNTWVSFIEDNETVGNRSGSENDAIKTSYLDKDRVKEVDTSDCNNHSVLDTPEQNKSKIVLKEGPQEVLKAANSDSTNTELVELSVQENTTETVNTAQYDESEALHNKSESAKLRKNKIGTIQDKDCVSDLPESIIDSNLLDPDERSDDIVRSLNVACAREIDKEDSCEVTSETISSTEVSTGQDLLEHLQLEPEKFDNLTEAESETHANKSPVAVGEEETMSQTLDVDQFLSKTTNSNGGDTSNIELDVDRFLSRDMPKISNASESAKQVLESADQPKQFTSDLNFRECDTLDDDFTQNSEDLLQSESSVFRDQQLHESNKDVFESSDSFEKTKSVAEMGMSNANSSVLDVISEDVMNNSEYDVFNSASSIKTSNVSSMAPSNLFFDNSPSHSESNIVSSTTKDDDSENLLSNNSEIDLALHSEISKSLPDDYLEK